MSQTQHTKTTEPGQRLLVTGMATTATWLDSAFQSAKDEFLGSLANIAKFDFKSATVKDVYAAVQDIEREQAKTKTFRGLARIRPLLKALEDYAGILDIFAQIKPDLLCLLWVRPYFPLMSNTTDPLPFYV